MRKLTKCYFKYCLGICLIITIVTIVTGCSSDKGSKIRSTDKAILLRINDFEDFLVDEAVDYSEASIKKRIMPNGVYELRYEYKHQGVFLESTIYVAPNLRLAKDKHLRFVNGIQARFSFLQGVTLKKMTSFRKWGNSSKFFVLQKNKTPLGNAFTVRSGLNVYNMVLSGVYFKDLKSFSDLVVDKIRLLKDYEK